MALQTLVLLALLLASGLGPGLPLVHRLRWTPLETLVGAIAASVGVVFIGGFACFLTHAGPGAYWALSGCFAVTTALQARRIGRLLRCRPVRAVLGAYALLVAWTFLLLCCVRHFGGQWPYDWAEHYQRTQLFLGQLPVDFRFINIYALPARPPMMNVLAAFYCRQVGIAPQGSTGPTGVSFEIFSLVFLLLNTGAIFPCALFYRRFQATAGRPRRERPRGERHGAGASAIAPLLLLLALNPTFVQNATYTWTKFLCLAYTILAIYFYLRGWETALRGLPGDCRAASYTVAAFLCLTLASLVHFLVAPYAVAIAGHFGWRMLRRSAGATGRVAVVSAALAGAVLAPWYAWSAAVFGVRTTLLAYFQSAAADPDVQRVSALHRILGNTYRTFVPYAYHAPLPRTVFAGDNPGVYFSDYWSVLAQSNPVFAMGSVGGLVVLGIFARTAWHLYRPVATARSGLADPPDFPDAPRSVGRRRETLFWMGLICVLLTLGDAASGFVEVFGSGRLCFPPLLLIGVTLLAARLPTLPRLLRVAVMVGAALDLLCGILLHFFLQDHVFGLRVDRGRLLIDSPGYGPVAAANWWTKRTLHLVFWGDHAAPAAAGVQMMILLLGSAGLIGLGFAAFGRRRPPPLG